MLNRVVGTPPTIDDAEIIDGKNIAADVLRKVERSAQHLKNEYRITPRIVCITVGDNPASKVYVRRKMQATKKVGLEFLLIEKSANTSLSELLDLIGTYNIDSSIHGILVQLPLPKQIDPGSIVDAVNPFKDIDGLHPINAGKLAVGRPSIVPCTALGCLLLAKHVQPNLTGLEAVVVGRSNLVSKPAALLLLRENCTVTIAHSKTNDLPEITRRADLLIVAVGVAGLVKGNWIKRGAIVIDVGINRIEAEDGEPLLVGDVAFEEARKVAGAITPVPGGVGPMTVACLLRNTVHAACTIHGLPAPDLCVLTHANGSA